MKPKYLRASLFHSVIFAGVLASASQSEAAPYSWTGLDSGTWNLGTNWSGNVIPGSSDDLTILGPLNLAGPLNINFDANNSAGSLIFTNTAATSITNTTSGADKVLTLGSGGLTTGAGAVQIGSTTVNQGVNITLGAAQSWNIGAGGLTVTNSIGGLGTGLTKTGGGLLTLNSTAVNTFTGGLNINGGTINLDFANLATPTNLIDAGNALQINNGALAITGQDSATNTLQTFNGTTLGGTINTLSLAKGASATSATLNLGALTITPGSVTTIFTGTAGSTTWATGVTPTSEIINITSFNGNALPGSGKVNVNAGLFYRQSTAAGSARWVSVDSAGQLQALPAGIAVLSATTNDPTVAHQLSGAAGTTTFTTTTASSYGLVLNPSGARILALAANGTYTINGIIGLVSSASTINAGAGASNIIIGSEKNLVINMDNSGALTINAPIANNGGGASAVTIASTMPTGTPGVVTFGGANTYTGATYISKGTLSLASANPLGTTPGVNGTSGISISAGAILQSATAGANPSTTIAAPITLSGSGNTTLRIGQGAGSNTHTFNINGAIGGETGDLVFTTTTGSFGNGSSVFVLGAAGTYTGNTLITTGNGGNNPVTVRAGTGVVNALPTSTVLTFDQVSGGGTGRNFLYDLNGNNQTLAGLDNGGLVPQVRRMLVTSATAAELTINNTANFTFGGSTVSTTIGTAGSTTRAQITGSIALTKSGTGTFTLGGTLAEGATAGGNTHTGNTKILGGILVLGEFNSLLNSAFDTAGSIAGNATNGLRITPNTLTLGGLTGNKNFADVFTSTAGGYTGLTALTLNPGTGVTNIYSADIGDGAGGLNLTKTGAGTQELAGTVSHTGTTTISAGTLSLTGSLTGGGAVSTSGTGILSQSAAGAISGASTFTQDSSGTSVLAGANSYTGTTTVNSGILTLDYGTQDNSKLSDTAALVLGGGTLNLVGGTHAETVLSTTLTAGTNSFITSSGAAPLQMNTITVGNGSSVDFGAGGIATTDNLNTAYGILGGWATVNGFLAVNSTNTADGLITAAVSSDVTRLDSGPQVISDGPTNNIRIVEGTGTAADITLGAATTTVNTLFQTASGGTSAATIDSGTQTLRTNAILFGAGAGALTIGNGTLSAANPGGDLELATTNSTNALTVNSVIANNTSSSTLTKTGAGTATLTNANLYGGLTTINGGALRITNADSLGTTAGGTVVNGSGTGSGSNARLELSGGITVTGETATLNGVGNFLGALSSFSGANEWAGPVTIGSAGTRLGATAGASLKVSGVIDSGAVNTGLVIRTTDLTGSVILSGANTYLGDTTVLIGKLQLDGGNDRLPVGTNLIISSSGANPDAEFDLNGRNQEVAGLSIGGGTATKNSVNNSDLVNLSTLTVNTAAASPSTFAGILKGNLALAKTGTDSLSLTGNNTFTGGISVTAGTLTAAKNAATLDALGTGAVSIASGSTLVIDILKTTNVTDTIANTFTGDGLLKLQFAAGTTTRNATMPNVTGFNGTIQLSNLGTTGDKWNATNLGTVAGSLLIDSGSTIFVSGGPASFTGGITLNGAGNSEGRGALRVNSATTVVGGNISLASSSTISMENVAAQVTGNISTSALAAHTLTLGATGSTGGILSGNISNGTGTLAVTQAAGSYSLSGELSHSGGVNVTNGTLTLSNANNTYTGVTAIGAGAGRVVLVTANNALGAIGSGNETTIAGTVGLTGSRLGFSGGINYSAQEKVIGAGSGDNRGFIQSVSGSNTFAGDIELSADGQSRIGTQNGAQLTLTGNITQSSGVTSASLLFRTGDLNGDFVTLSGTGNSLGGDSQVFTSLATAGEYAGLRIGADNAHPTNLTVQNFSSASGSQTALDLNGKNQALNGLDSAGAGTLNIINLDTVNTSTLTLNPTADKNSGANIVILGGSPGGTPLGVINVVKEGAFAQTLGGASTYTGTTAVSAGTLFVTGALSSSAVTVQAAGAIGGSGTLGNGLTIQTGGNLDLTGAMLGADSTGILSITGGSLTLGDLTFQDLVGWNWMDAAPGTYELIDGGFTVNFGSTAFLDEASAYDFGNGKSGYFTSGSLNAVIIPEPSTALLGTLGMLALLRRRRD